MKGLTLHRPWPWAIFRFNGEGEPKRVENRSARPPASIIGQVVAIHAGQKWDRDGEWFIRAQGGVLPYGDAEFPEVWHCGGKILGVATISGYVSVTEYHRMTEDQASAVVLSRWYSGPCGWILSNVRALPTPVQHRGAQGFWTVEPDAEKRIWDMLGL